MSCSTLLTSNEISTSSDLRCHHGLNSTNRSNETLSIIVQSSTVKPTNKSLTRNNPSIKRNLRDKRRATGIRPDEVLIAEVSTIDVTGEEDENEENTSIQITESNELLDPNRTMPSSYCSKPMFTVSRIQPSLDGLSIPRADSHSNTISSVSSSLNKNTSLSAHMFRPEEFILHRVEKSIPDADSSTLIYQQLEERIIKLESVVYDKDVIINDLQRKLDKVTRELSDMEQQNYILHQEKLTLINAFTGLQDHKV